MKISLLDIPAPFIFLAYFTLVLFISFLYQVPFCLVYC